MDTPPSSEDPKPRRRVPMVAVGGLAALVAGLAIAGLLVSGGSGGKTPPPPASEGGLVIDASGGDGQIDPGKPLRCFVQGQYVGELSLSDCARRNGVATDALDVGLDETGALAAAEQAGQVLTPLPPTAQDAEQPDTPAAPSETAAPVVVEPVGAAGACWRRDGGRWRKLPGDIDLGACVQTLFAGRCEKPGGATYGRWGSQTLRLVTGRVEVSDDNRSFRPLAPQNPDCSIGPPQG